MLSGKKAVLRKKGLCKISTAKSRVYFVISMIEQLVKFRGERDVSEVSGPTRGEQVTRASGLMRGRTGPQ